jgi:hypothetical protein
MILSKIGNGLMAYQQDTARISEVFVHTDWYKN